MYQDISLGFEAETQKMCLLFTGKGKHLRLPSEYTKHAFLQNSVEVYNDTLTPTTAFARNTLDPFMEQGGLSEPWPLAKDFVLEKGVEGTTFNNNEFVVTFTRKQTVDRKDFFFHLFGHFIKALDKMEAILEHYTMFPIENPRFPYHSLLVSKDRDPRFSKVAFFAQSTTTDFSISDLTFYYQCTIGFRIEDAISLFTELAHWYYTSKGLPNPEEALVQQAQTLEGSPLLQNYLFLFLYSASTRHSRKVGTLFILRHAFQDIQEILSAEDRVRLDRWMVSHRHPTEYAYFQSLHGLAQGAPLSQEEKYKKQAIWDVGRLPFRKREGRVFVEFRGFQSLLNHIVGGPKSPKSMETIRQAIKNFFATEKKE